MIMQLAMSLIFLSQYNAALNIYVVMSEFPSNYAKFYDLHNWLVNLANNLSTTVLPG